MTCTRIFLGILSVALLATPARAAQATPDCEDWNTQAYFEAATVEAVTACLAAGADPMAGEDYSELTPLHMAAIASTSPEVIAVLLAAGSDVNARVRGYGAPLEAALRSETSGEPAVIEALLVAGADPNVRDGNDWTPLHQAAYEAEDADVISALIEAGAALDARTMDTPHEGGGMTPLHIAVDDGADGAEPAAMEALLAAGADVNARTDFDTRPLHMVKLHRAKKEVAEMLLAAGADVNARAAAGSTPLHSALTPTPRRTGETISSNNNLALVEVLLAAGADVNARDEAGNTPLHRAAADNENPTLIEALLAAGADVTERTDDGRTPLDLATGRAKRETRELLRAHQRDRR